MKSKRIVIVDYDMGNLHFVFHKLKRLGNHVIVSSSATEILSAERIILPGVGHFGSESRNQKLRLFLL